jgi:hypothetical protein
VRAASGEEIAAGFGEGLSEDGTLAPTADAAAVTPAREALLLGSSPARMEIRAMRWGLVRRSKGGVLDMVVSKKGKARSKSRPC